MRQLASIILLIMMSAMNAYGEIDHFIPRLASGDLLTGVSYRNSGDELGNLYQVILQWTDDERLVLQVREAETHADPVRCTLYDASPDTLLRIAELVDSHEMTAWDQLPELYFVCDAPQPYLTLIIRQKDETQRECTISGYADFPAGSEEVFRQVLDILLKNIQTDRIIDRYTEEAE